MVVWLGNFLLDLKFCGVFSFENIKILKWVVYDVACHFSAKVDFENEN